MSKRVHSTLMCVTLLGCGASPTPLRVELPQVLQQHLGTFTSVSAVVTITSTDAATGGDRPAGSADSAGDGQTSGPVPVYTSDPIPAGSEPITLTVELAPGDYQASCRYRDTRASGTPLDLLELSTAEFTVFPGREATASVQGGGQISFDADEDSFSNIDEIIRWESDPEASAVAWHYEISGEGTYNVYDAGDGLLLIADGSDSRTSGGGLIVVNAATGAEVWSNPNASLPLVDAAAGEILAFVTTVAGTRVAALDNVTGAVLWDSDLFDSIADTGVELGLTQLANGKIVFVTMGELYVIANDGASLITYGMPDSQEPTQQCRLTGSALDSRAVAGNVIYAVAENRCFNLTEQVLGMSALVAVDFTGSPTATFVASNATLGTEEGGGITGNCLTVAGGNLYYSNGGIMKSLSTAGTVRWSVTLAPPISAGEPERCEGDTAPIVAGGVVYAATRAGGVTAIQDSNGAVLWTKSSFGSAGPYGGGFVDGAPSREASPLTLLPDGKLLTLGKPDTLGVLSMRPVVIDPSADGALLAIGANGLTADGGASISNGGRMAGDASMMYLVVPDRSGSATISYLIATTHIATGSP